MHAPQVLAQDLGAGLPAAHRPRHAHLSAGARRRATPPQLFADATDALVRWQLATRPGELPPYDEALLRREMQLFPDWYVARHLRRRAARTQQKRRSSRSSRLLVQERARPAEGVRAPRLHAAQPHGVRARIPACSTSRTRCIGPITYDVVSLLRDAFISWDEERGARLDRALLGEGASAPACRSTRISASSGAPSNGWACSATSRCSASSRASTTATASPGTSPTRRASSRYARAVAEALLGELAPARRRLLGRARTCKAMILAAGPRRAPAAAHRRLPKALLGPAASRSSPGTSSASRAAGFREVGDQRVAPRRADRRGAGRRHALRPAHRATRASASRSRPRAASPRRCALLGERAVPAGERRHLLRIRFRARCAASSLGARARAPGPGAQSAAPQRAAISRSRQGASATAPGARYTYAGIAVMSPRTGRRRSSPGNKAPLAPLLYAAAAAAAVGGELYRGAVAGRRDASSASPNWKPHLATEHESRTTHLPSIAERRAAPRRAIGDGVALVADRAGAPAQPRQRITPTASTATSTTSPASPSRRRCWC